ncbi:glycosyltransferase family 1 protein [Enterococcus faecium]|uniref:glycosyltransferase family 1 protein n=1 Tax=Enterococcus faecium TaxID=1352 RepID=UPI001367BBA1|nr:glycosyltransferase family 1 protein [Enterococcus faecium]MBJ1625236.1 glycosyltransferase family 1 protein [Enterococcus faecium]MBK0955527.1 glycosyltransferase family 1 protein [Enterococcus faecium]MDH2765180.1 glycosyltransferase family 1 protein [Enterococcus faecium]MXS23945.1 glycosyltransferase [Enterococcus faecium]
MNSEIKPVRIAQIMGKLWAGGVEAVVFNYYREIDKEKIQYDFYYDDDSTVEPPQELIDMGARFIRIPPYQKLPAYLKTLRKHFKENDYSLVHSHINTLSIFPLFAAWTARIPVRIAHNHSVPGGNEIRRNILKYILRCFAKVFATDYFACSEKAGRWMFGNRAFEKGKVQVLKNAVDFDRFRPEGEVIEPLREKIGLKGKFVVGHVGRFTFAKNHTFLIEIFVELAKEREDAVLLLVGDGELHDQINAMVKQAGIEDKVVFAGQVNDPEKYYRLANVILVPSVFEGLSLTTIESQIAGIPTVVSESVPEEAIIGEGVARVSLTKSANEWAKIVLDLSKQKVVLDDRSKNYEMKGQSKKLTKWYVNKLASIKGEKHA